MGLRKTLAFLAASAAYAFSGTVEESGALAFAHDATAAAAQRSLGFAPAPPPSSEPTKCAEDADQWVTDIVVIETNITTRVVTTKRVCDVPGYASSPDGSYAFNGALAVVTSGDGGMTETAQAGFAAASDPRTPYPFTLPVVKRHARKIPVLRQKAEHDQLKAKAQATTSRE